MTAIAASQAWLKRRERSNPVIIKIAFWMALRIGRRMARLLLHPICLYYVIFSPSSRAASRGFLLRVFGHLPGAVEIYRHHFYFGACLLDRIFLLHDRQNLFDIHVHGEDVVAEILAGGRGCILAGAHAGSFEIVRAIGRKHGAMRVALLMYQENAQKLMAGLEAIRPKLSTEIISLGRRDSMLKVRDLLDAGAFIGILADRSIQSEERSLCPFLDEQAAFPIGPFRLAKILRCPMVMMLGLYDGGNRYDVYFEKLADWPEASRIESQTTADQALRSYVARLEQHIRRSPYNWFNFYDIWH